MNPILSNSLAAAVLTALYVGVAHVYFPDFVPSALEIVGVATGMACVFLAREQVAFTWIYGAISATAMGVFFFQIDLIGQGFLHLSYYLPVQFLGLYYWLYGGDEEKGVEIGVLSDGQRVLGLVVIVGLTLIGTYALHSLFPSGQYPMWDMSIVAASIVAQYLLACKKLEAWVLWLVPVNISAIGIYVATEAFIFAFLYVVFLVNAALAFVQWNRDYRAVPA
jgi:nicotinamide mononucleotide transporter